MYEGSSESSESSVIMKVRLSRCSVFLGRSWRSLSKMFSLRIGPATGDSWDLTVSVPGTMMPSL